MAHMIEEIAGKPCMAYAGETPWHGLGTLVPADVTPAQMLEAAGLDWTVEPVESYIKHNGVEIPTGMKSLVRSIDSKVLTNIGENWEPIQNHEAFDFFNEFVMAGDMEMHTAGSLKGGQIVWGLAKVKESFALNTSKGEDVVESYLLFSNFHKYGFSTDCRFTPTRVVCNNTLTLALGAAAENVVKLNHRRKFNADEVKVTLGIASEKLAQYKEMGQFLSSKRYTADNLIEYFTGLFPKHNTEKVWGVKDMSRNAVRAVEVLHTQPGAELGEGTWWQAYNAVTYLTDHELGRNADSRLTSSWYGTNRNLKVRALESAVAMAEAA
jgi:phage/plasmid-like protein (TIGR03299 family)